MIGPDLLAVAFHQYDGTVAQLLLRLALAIDESWYGAGSCGAPEWSATELVARNEDETRREEISCHVKWFQGDGWRC